MENIRYELKYCEGCGTLKLRPVVAGSQACRVCEQMLTRFRFPRKMLAKGRGQLPQIAERKLRAGTAPAAGQAAAAGRVQ
jgi:hypothetical protein